MTNKKREKYQERRKKQSTTEKQKNKRYMYNSSRETRLKKKNESTMTDDKNLSKKGDLVPKNKKKELENHLKKTNLTLQKIRSKGLNKGKKRGLKQIKRYQMGNRNIHKTSKRVRYKKTMNKL